MQLISIIKRVSIFPFVLVIRFYQKCISPFLGQNCRFYPSCSCYAHQALNKHGLMKGSYLSVVRIMKCNPMHEGGIDLVPEAAKRKRPLHPTESKLNFK